MERLCKNCQGPITETTRIDAIFCSPKCGWTHRNRIKREEHLKAINTRLQDPTEKNYRIIKFLHENNQTAISRDALIGIGFNPEIHSGMRKFDRDCDTSEFMIKDFVLTLGPDEIITIQKSI